MKNMKRIRLISRFIKPYIMFFIVAEICIIVSYAVSIILPLNLTKLVDKVFYAERYDLLKEVIFTYVVLFIISTGFNLIYSYTWQTLNNRYIVDVKTSVFKRIIYSKANILSNMNSGDMMSRIDNDSEQFIHIIQRNVFHFINSILLCAVIIYMVARINIIIAIMLIVAALLPIIFTKILGKYTEKQTYKLRILESIQTGKIFEILKGIREIILLKAQWWGHKTLFRNFKAKILLENKISAIDFAANKIIYIINLITSLIIYGYSVYLIYSGELTIGFFLAVIEYIALLHKKINWTLRIYLDWHNRKISIDRIGEVLDYETERKGIIEIKEIDTIEFKNVSFAYDNTPVLKNITFKINKGEKTAIVGVSGVGKTTITGLLLRYYDINEGEILLNNNNIQEIDCFNIRKNIGIVQQEINLFKDTLRYNLSISNDNSEEELIDACKKVGIYDLIKTLPNGFDTVIGNGVDLSGGQKQRIMLARILLKNIKTIIFDEATSALDNESETLILDEFEKLGDDITMIIISHKKSTIQNCNNIIVLDNGKIESIGKHSILTDRSEIYKNMFSEVCANAKL